MKNHAPTINPYVTSRGGVVILNGPFPIDQANRVAALCKTAPDLLAACEAALLHAQLIGSGQPSPYSNAEICELTGAAIAKARPA